MRKELGDFLTFGDAVGLYQEYILKGAPKGSLITLTVSDASAVLSSRRDQDPRNLYLRMQEPQGRMPPYGVEHVGTLRIYSSEPRYAAVRDHPVARALMQRILPGHGEPDILIGYDGMLYVLADTHTAHRLSRRVALRA